MAKRFLTPLNIVNLASNPATGAEGDIYYNTTSDSLKIYSNGLWSDLGGAAINVSASAPVAPTEGDAWFDNTDGKFYVYDGSFWVETGSTDAAFSSYNRWTKTISASTTIITGLDDSGETLDYSPGLEHVYINGVFIDESSYTKDSGSSIILNEAVYPTDLIEILWLTNLAVSDTYSKSESDAKFITISSASSTYIPKTSQQSIINTASAAAVTYLVDSAPGALDTLNELAQAINDDASFSTTITNSLASKLSISTASATYVTIEDANTSLVRWTKTFSGSTTVVSGIDDYSNTLDYQVGFLTVFINGILIDPPSYTATDGINIVLAEPVLNTDVVEILSYRTFNVANTYTQSQADNRFLTFSTASSNYLTIQNASATYATLNQLNNIDLTSTINTASAAAFASSSAYTNSQINSLTTSDIEEGTRLYFTNQRAIDSGSATYILQTSQQGIINSASAAAFASASAYTDSAIANFEALPSQSGNAGKYLTTSGSTTSWESLDLNAAINTASAAAVAYADGLTTADVAENTNLYFTNERAVNAGSATYVLQTSQQGIINSASAAAVSYLVDSAPGTLDTLNELAAALGDDPNYATTITNALGNKLDTATASTVYLTQTSASSTYATKSELDNIEALPLQTGNSGKYLTTNGASASWAELNTNSVMSRWTKAYSASTSTISGSDDNSLSLTYSPSFISVYINGILIDPTNYTATNGTIISVVEPVQVNDIVEVMSSSVATIANTYTQEQIDAKYNTISRWTKIYSASATVVSGNDDNSNALSYVVGYENVYLNGILLTPVTDYARTSASVITLNQTVISGDIIDVVKVEPFNIVDTYSTTQADSKFLTQVNASTTYLTQSSASTLYSLPTQTGNSGKYLTTSGASASWSSVDALPSQTGNSGKYLTTSGASASWATLDLSTKADKLVTFDPETASYTLLLSNADQIVEMNVASANNLTVPLNSSVAFPVGTQITILQTGSGQTTIVATVGVTINSTPGLKLRTQWSSATLIKRAENTWVAIGDLTA